MSIENDSFGQARRSLEAPTSLYATGDRGKPSTPASSTPKRRTSKVHFVLNPGSGMLMSTSRQEFLPGEPNGGIRYNRKGGVFVNKWGCVLIILAVFVLIIMACTIVYFFAPRRNDKNAVTENDMSYPVGPFPTRAPEDTVRLVNSVKPSFYRLVLRPNLKTMTFEGVVNITLSTMKSTVKHISLHVNGLEILNETTLVEQKMLLDKVRVRRQAVVNGTTPTIVANANATQQQQFVPQQPLGKTATSSSGEQQIKAGSVLLSQTRPKKMKIISKELSPTLERIVFALDSHLKPNANYTLSMSFRGVIDDSLLGFYRSSYVDGVDNTTKLLAATQFEPTSARKAFPCFDEPEFKAMFEISIGCHKNYTVVSNMPLSTPVEIDPDNTTRWWHFDRSLPMAPYLVAYTVTEFKAREAVIPQGTFIARGGQNFSLKVWSRREYEARTAYAADVAPRMLAHFEAFFGIPYALPKLDLFAVPDFSVNGMENWGLVTFSETYLLIDEKDAAMKNKKEIAAVLAHELAHQWFGNLVTMTWWDDLWLNEGFATYMEYIGVNHVHPDWGMMDMFFLERYTALGVDSIENTHPVSMPVNDETQITQLFDEISYKKAANLIRMLNHILLKDNFQAGLQKYMNKWQFKNADKNDLWEAFTSAVTNTSLLPPNVSVSTFMNPWILESGYPVINVERHDENNTAVITQQRFLLHGPQKKKKKYQKKQLWHIPITFTYGNITSDKWNTTPQVWLEKVEKKVIEIPQNINTTWLYFNVLGIGYYRVNYDIKSWKALEYGLYDRPTDFPPVARAHLLDDSFNLAKAGYLNYTVPLDLTKYMIDIEMEYLPWVAALDNLKYLHISMQNSTHFKYFLDYINRLIMPTIEKLGYVPLKNDTLQTTLLREYLISWACLIEEEKCLDWAKEHFSNWMNQSNPDLVNPIPKNSRTTIYTTALQRGGRREFEFLFDRFQNSNDPEVKEQIVNVLPSTNTVWQLNRLLEYSITEMDIKFTTNLWDGLTSDLAKRRAFRFVSRNWDRIFARYAKVDDIVLQDIINGAFNNIDQEQELREFKRFINEHTDDLSKVSKSVYKNVEEAVLRIQWTKTKMKDIERWLKKFSETKPTDDLDEFSTLYGDQSSRFQNEDSALLIFENPLDYALYMG